MTEQPPGSEPAAPGNAASYPAPSSDAADVEIEEVPVGGPQAARPATEVLAEMGDKPAAAGGGGANVPAGGDAGEGEDASGATGQALAGGGAAGMTAPNFQLGGETEAQQREVLDRALDAKLAKFDEIVRRARAAADEEYAAAGASGSLQGQVDGRGLRIDDPPDGAGGAAATGSGLGNTPDLAGETGGAAQPSPIAAGVPPDLADATNDDVVARQLREAASAERDPVLREKLWVEYRKYKANL